MVGILPIFPKMPYVTVKVLYNHGLIDGIRIDLGTSVVMLITSDIEDSLNASSTRWLG
jgi:hypothetical protein